MIIRGLYLNLPIIIVHQACPQDLAYTWQVTREYTHINMVVSRGNLVQGTKLWELYKWVMVQIELIHTSTSTSSTILILFSSFPITIFLPCLWYKKFHFISLLLSGFGEFKCSISHMDQPIQPLVVQKWYGLTLKKSKIASNRPHIDRACLWRVEALIWREFAGIKSLLSLSTKPAPLYR